MIPCTADVAHELTYNVQQLQCCYRPTEVGHITSVESCITGVHLIYDQLVLAEVVVGREVGTGVDQSQCLLKVWKGVDVPLVEGHCGVGCVGAVESEVSASQGLQRE